MQGKIIRGVGGFYYISDKAGRVWECRARGILRREGVKPVPGDDAEFAPVSEETLEGNLTRILPRRNALVRPAAANVDQALVVFAADQPALNLNLLDRFLLAMADLSIPVVICINKWDLAAPDLGEKLDRIYAACGCPLIPMSVRTGLGLAEADAALTGKTTVVAGPSGVGKSSFTNYIQPEASMEVGEVSRKIGRGRQTTRHTQLVRVREDTYFMDTPGFGSLFLPDITPAQAEALWPEAAPYRDRCRFQGCMHMSEPDCAVKEAIGQGRISPERYENYCLFVRELKEKKKY